MKRTNLTKGGQMKNNMVDQPEDGSNAPGHHKWRLQVHKFVLMKTASMFISNNITS